jgi:hypothetical protein
MNDRAGSDTEVRWRGRQWQDRRHRRLRRFIVLRVGLWLLLVAAVIGLNLLIGGRFWGIGFIVITGGLLVVRLASVWFMYRRVGENRPGIGRFRGRGGGGWSDDSTPRTLSGH